MLTEPTSLPYLLPTSNSNTKSTVRLRSAKDVVLQSCPWATNVSINTSIRLANGDASNAIEILVENKEKELLEGRQAASTTITTTLDSASIECEEDEEGGRELDETAVYESHNVSSKKAKRPKRPKRPTRGGPCPCGSGLVYKKCCKKKTNETRKKTGEMGGSNATSTQDDDDLFDSFQRVIVL